MAPASIGIALAAKAASHFQQSFSDAGGIIGTLVSGCFLYLIAALNLVVLLGILKMWKQVKAGNYEPQELEQLLSRADAASDVAKTGSHRRPRAGPCLLWFVQPEMHTAVVGDVMSPPRRGPTRMESHQIHRNHVKYRPFGCLPSEPAERVCHAHQKRHQDQQQALTANLWTSSGRGAPAARSTADAHDRLKGRDHWAQPE